MTEQPREIAPGDDTACPHCTRSEVGGDCPICPMLASERSLHAPWLEVANAALREVGVEPLWEVGPHGPWLPNGGVSRDHYRSAVMAHLAVGASGFAAGRRTRPGHVVCWPCWEADTADACTEVATERALHFEECSR